MRLSGRLTFQEASEAVEWTEEELESDYILAIMLFAQITYLAERGERLFQEDVTQKFGVLKVINLPIIEAKHRREHKAIWSRLIKTSALRAGRAITEQLKEIYPASKLQDLKTILLIDTGSALEAQGRIVPVESISHLYYKKEER